VPLVLGPAALLALPRGAFVNLAAAWIAALLPVHAALFGISRMHQPVVPILVLAAALALPGVGLRWRRGAVAGAVALALGVLSLPPLVGVYLLPGPRHATVARALASVRHLPLPGTRHAAWMLAEVEAARGRDDAAIRVLDESAPPDDPGTFLLRALCAPNATERVRWAARGLEMRPDSELLRALSATEGTP
jgi:hypothetical protein